jgi:hypothetical protein
MERLDTLVARVLADARRAMDERAGEARSLPGKAARAEGGAKAPALARGEAHPRSSQRAIAKRAANASVKRDTNIPM